MNLEELISQQNGNGNGNGNGHKKVFELAQPKSADEIARATILQAMPKLRRECSKDRRLSKLVGAKWLFCTLTDLSFLHVYGGDGFGKIFISVKDLVRIFGHDEKTICNWRDALITAGWIWYQKMSPKSCWGISGVTRQPELFGPGWEVARSMARASADGDRSGSGGVGDNSNSAISNGKTGVAPVGDRSGSGGGPERLRFDTGTAPVEDRSGSGGAPEGTGQQTGAAPVEDRSGSGSEPEGMGIEHRNGSSAEPEALRHIRETPLGVGSSGDTEGASFIDCAPVPPPPEAEKFRKKIKDLFPSRLEKLKAELTRQKREADPADAAGLASLNWRLAEIETELCGGRPPAKRKAPAAARPATPPTGSAERLKNLGASMRRAVAEAKL